MLILDLFWVVFGLGYILYRGFKDEGFAWRDVPVLLKLLAVFLTPLLAIGTVAALAENASGTVKTVLSVLAILLVLAAMGGCLYMAFYSWRLNQSDVRPTQDAWAEVEALRRLPDEELGRLLGVPLAAVPLDGLGRQNVFDHATEADRRRAYAIALILRRRGLRYYRRISPGRDVVEYPILETKGGKAFLAFLGQGGENKID